MTEKEMNSAGKGRGYGLAGTAKQCGVGDTGELEESL